MRESGTVATGSSMILLRVCLRGLCRLATFRRNSASAPTADVMAARADALHKHSMSEREPMSPRSMDEVRETEAARCLWFRAEPRTVRAGRVR